MVRETGSGLVVAVLVRVGAPQRAPMVAGIAAGLAGARPGVGLVLTVGVGPSVGLLLALGVAVPAELGVGWLSQPVRW